MWKEQAFLDGKFNAPVPSFYYGWNMSDWIYWIDNEGEWNEGSNICSTYFLPILQQFRCKERVQ